MARFGSASATSRKRGARRTARQKLTGQVGPRGGLQLPAQTPVLTAAVVTPGLIDAHAVVPVSGALNIPADQEQDERREVDLVCDVEAEDAGPVDLTAQWSMARSA